MFEWSKVHALGEAWWQEKVLAAAPACLFVPGFHTIGQGRAEWLDRAVRRRSQYSWA
jgi:hypothetical protein